MRIKSTSLSVAIGAAAALAGADVGAATDDSRLTVGIVETVRIEPGSILLEAKVDTGADTTSLHARNVTKFSRDGRDWVRFETGGKSESTVIERPVTRMIRIRRSGTEKERRPVVMLRICVGTLLINAEVNLADRTGMSYPILLGRKLLAGRMTVDPGRQHLTRPVCREE